MEYICVDRLMEKQFELEKVKSSNPSQDAGTKSDDKISSNKKHVKFTFLDAESASATMRSPLWSTTDLGIT
jgi:hypothetical protein